MFNLGVPELILILVIALVVFGPGKLPEVGKAIGRGLKEFRSAANKEEEKTVESEEEPKTVENKTTDPKDESK